MLVAYDGDGNLLHTIKIRPGAPRPAGVFLEVEDDLDLGSLADWQVADGALVKRLILNDVQRQSLLDKITEARGKAREKYITVLPGQEMVYLEKRAEAEAFLAHPAPTPELFPMVFAEVGITAPTAAEVAAVWLNMSDLWRSVSAVIEAATLKADGLVRAATLASEAEAAVAEMRATLADLAFG